MPGTFKAYADSIKSKTDMSLDDFWKLAIKKGVVKRGEVTKRHSEIVEWVKSETKLGHVHASFITAYLRLRAKDPTVTANMKRFARASGYKF